MHNVGEKYPQTPYIVGTTIRHTTFGVWGTEYILSRFRVNHLFFAERMSLAGNGLRENDLRADARRKAKVATVNDYAC